jgi:hypothetical protein
MLMMLLVSTQPLVFAAKFNLGDTVEVFNTGASGLLVRDAPAGNIIGKKYDGYRGMILAGPQSAPIGGVVYTWWKVRWGDDALEGWSAEGYPGGVDYLKKVSVSPSTKFSIGNLVKVSTGGPSLIVRTDPPPSSDLSYKGSVADGTVGKVLGGPFYGVPQGASGFYYFWKVDYLSIVGWSAEDWLTKVVGEPAITSSLVLVQSPPYYVGNTITARFTITNRATAPFTFDVLTVGGRDPDNQVADFTWIRSITLNPVASYNYQGTLTLTKVGNYHFFCAYRTPWGDWNTAIPTEGGATNTLNIYVNPTPPPPRTLTVYSSPSGVTFTVDGVSRTTPWSATYSQGASVSLVMPSTHSVGATRYYWDRWSDGVTSRSRTVIMDTDVTLTAYYTGPYYQLTVTSSPITGIPFTINGVSKTTSYTEWLLQGFYAIEMPATYSGYTWSHWLEDGDTNRIKTITLSSTTTLTAAYTSPPPADTTPPATVTDLSVSEVTTDSVTLTWTAPGDDGNIGTASEYDIRYSTSSITEANWNLASQVLGEPKPSVAGSMETFVVTGLSPGTTYYFALKTADEVPNWSGLSNVARGPILIPGRDVPTEAPDFFPSVLTKLHIPTSQFAVQVLTIWTNYENTGAYWNPLATTLPMGEKSWNFNEAGVKNYVDKETGFQATANTLALHYYESIREMLAIKSFNEQNLRQAVANWSGLNPNDPYVVNLVGEWRNIWDIHWLAKAIVNEAGGVDVSEQERKAVGWTVLNRLDSGRYGKSIQEVVEKGYAPYWGEPHKEPSDSEIKLAEDLLDRKIQDPTDGATHFFSPRSQTVGYGPYPVPGTPETALYPWWVEPRDGWEIITQTTTHYVTIKNELEWKQLEGIRNWYFMFYRPYTTRIHERIESPGELRVYDSQGRVTGLVNGTVMIEIPGSDYFENTVTIFFPNDTYRYIVAGKMEELYGLMVTAVTRQENITFSAIDIPTSAEAIHQYTIDWTLLDEGGFGVDVRIDQNDDRVFEHQFLSDSQLTREELEQAIAHDISVKSIILSKRVIGQGYTSLINITFENQGIYEEAFNITLYANTTVICTFTNISLISGNSNTMTFTWNTTGFAKGNYTIWAYAWSVPGETDTFDNTFTDDVVTVTIPGDLDGNFAVQLVDLVTLAKAYGSKPGEPNWNPNADLDDNHIIGLTDLVIMAKNYGKTDP